MAAHYVICSVCGKRFDRDKEQAVKTGARRYAHYDCCPDGELVPMPQPTEKKTTKKVVDEDLVKLMDYIQKLLGKNYNHARVNQQIKKFREEYKYSYSGILKSLVYFYDVKGNAIEKANGGIGIVPFVYQDAFNYYYALWQAQSINKEKHINIIPKVKEVTIKPPTVEKHMTLFFMNDEEDTNE